MIRLGLFHHREAKARSGAPLWLCAGSTGAFRYCIHPCFYRGLGCTSLRTWAFWLGWARYSRGWACGMHCRRPSERYCFTVSLTSFGPWWNLKQIWKRLNLDIHMVFIKPLCSDHGEQKIQLLRVLMITMPAAHLAANSDINAKTSNSEQLTAPSPLLDHGITYKCLLVGEKDCVACVALLKSCVPAAIYPSAAAQPTSIATFAWFSPSGYGAMGPIHLPSMSLLHRSCSLFNAHAEAVPFGGELNEFGSPRS